MADARELPSRTAPSFGPNPPPKFDTFRKDETTRYDTQSTNDAHLPISALSQGRNEGSKKGSPPSLPRNGRTQSPVSPALDRREMTTAVLPSVALWIVASLLTLIWYVSYRRPISLRFEYLENRPTTLLQIVEKFILPSDES